MFSGSSKLGSPVTSGVTRRQSRIYFVECKGILTPILRTWVQKSTLLLQNRGHAEVLKKDPFFRKYLTRVRPPSVSMITKQNRFSCWVRVLPPVRSKEKRYTTLGSMVVWKPNREDRSSIEQGSHKEVDSQLVLLVCDAGTRGHQKIMVRTGDIYVVVIIVSSLQNTPVTEV